MRPTNLNHSLEAIARPLAAALVALSLVLGAAPAKAAGDWKVTVTPYVWATDLRVKADLNGRQVVDQDVSVTDLVKKLDTIFQGRVDVQYRRFGLATDLFDVTMSDHVQGIPLPQGAGTGEFVPDIRMTIVDAAAFYSPKMRARALAVLGGMRMVYERADVDATYHLASGANVGQSYETHDTIVDAMLGLRLTQPLSRHFGVQGQVDASTGGTKYTWSAAPQLFYVFDDARRYAVSAGYRHMHIDFKESDGLDSDMALSGAIVGFRMSY